MGDVVEAVVERVIAAAATRPRRRSRGRARLCRDAAGTRYSRSPSRAAAIGRSPPALAASISSGVLSGSPPCRRRRGSRARPRCAAGTPVSRIGHVVGRLVDQVLEIVAALGIEEAAAVAVGVDVEQRLPLQLVGMGLGPFGRAEQPRLLAVPARVDDGARRPPALARAAPSAFASLISATCPVSGSEAPNTQPSWWLPRTIHWSG